MNMVYAVTFFGSIAVGLIVLAAIVLAFRQGPGSEAPVLLYEVLRRQGDEVARLALASGSRSFALAVGECLRCSSTARCRAWLDGESREGIGQFCPNAGYILRMRGWT